MGIFKIAFLFIFISFRTYGQSDSVNVANSSDTLSKMEIMMIKGENLFKILPVPIFSYTTETGLVVGLAKYNLINLVKNDTIS